MCVSFHLETYRARKDVVNGPDTEWYRKRTSTERHPTKVHEKEGESGLFDLNCLPTTSVNVWKYRKRQKYNQRDVYGLLATSFKYFFEQNGLRIINSANNSEYYCYIFE